MNNFIFSITTDTATLSIFDLQSLKHRLTDTPDWWSIPEDEIEEINQGNVIFLNLGTDGHYQIEICENLDGEYHSLFLNVPSGTIFIGAGEDTTGDDLEPTHSQISGTIVNIPIGKYEVKFKKNNEHIKLSFALSNHSTNCINESVRI